MKKLFLVLCFCLLSTVVLFSSSLEMIDMSSSIYDEIEDLYIIEGKASPLGAKPWSKVDVYHLLNWIEPKTEMGIALKKRISDSIGLDRNELYFDFSVALDSNAIIRTDKSVTTLMDSKDLDRSLFDMGLGFYYSDNVALFMNLSLGHEIYDIQRIQLKDSFIEVEDEKHEFKLIANKNDYIYSSPSIFFSNIPTSMASIDYMNFPSRYYAAFGNDFFRVAAGRDRLELGNGKMGNVLLGDTLPFHDSLSLTFTGSNWFQYQLLVDFYTPFENFEKSDRDPLEGIRFLLSHRFEFNLFSGKLLFALTDSVMYHSESMYIDPRVLSPMFFLHNAYIAGNSNSLAALEIEYAPVKNFSLYGQFALDDLALPGEPQPPDAASTPNSFALMLGTRYRYPFEKGYLYGNIEGVFTSPFMYLRGHGDGYKAGGYNYSFISSLRYRHTKGLTGIFRYLSFPFGSDSISALCTLGYKMPGLFDVAGNIFFMAHGVIDKFSVSRWYTGKENVNPHFPSTSNPFDESEKGSVEYTFSIGAEGSYSPLSWLDLNAGMYLVSIWNMDNIASLNKIDVQFSIGAKIYY